MPTGRGLGTHKAGYPHVLPLHSSHIRLLKGVTAGVPESPHAIVVPSHRSAGHLDYAGRLASLLGSTLVVVWSHPTVGVPLQHPFAGWSAVSPPAPPAVVVASAGRFPAPWPGAASPAAPVLPGVRAGDQADKRNLGVMLGRLLGWEHVLFLDDDVSGLDLAAIRRAVGSLKITRAASWRQADFPDNSVVCHAHRLVGGTQDVFIGGAFLATLGDDTPFFPPVYNEDWLFLYPWLVDRQVRYGGDVRQQPYDPFATPLRAAGEEFGDVLAEGLMELLHLELSLPDADLQYWRRMIDARAALIDWTEDSLGLARVSRPERQAIRASLHAARTELGRIEPHLLAGFVSAWQGDLARWRQDLRALQPVAQSLPEHLRLEQALDRLGLREHIAWASWR